jgi:hypothetical protein
MLSLVKELKKVPEALKLYIKSDLLNVFKRARLQQHDTPSFVPVLVVLSHDKPPSK